MITIKKNIKALLFDCDGTLVDSMPLHFEVWKETFESFGRTYPHNFVDARKGLPVVEVLRQYNKHYNDNIDVTVFSETREENVLKRLHEVRGVEPVISIVNKYHGILPMAVCSGSIKKAVMISLKAINMTTMFDVILTADDNFPAKPASDIFIAAARKLNISPENCQVFEDGDPGIEAALNAGMTATDIRKYI